jgi:AcrR family transcriptional regulator
MAPARSRNAQKEASVEASRPRRSSRKGGQDAPVGSDVAILDCAAQCFMEAGFQGTSIDDVARRLGATKGLIYHYYSSKTDLFFDVHREGMRRLDDAVDAAALTGSNARETLQAMLEAHALTMLQNIAFLAVVVQGVHMHRISATTPAQRAALDEIMAIRGNFEKKFLATIKRGAEDGSIAAENPSIAVKSMLGAINWTAIWYRPRAGETAAQQRAIAAQIARQQIDGVMPR